LDNIHWLKYTSPRSWQYVIVLQHLLLELWSALSTATLRASTSFCFTTLHTPSRLGTRNFLLGAVPYHIRNLNAFTSSERMNALIRHISVPELYIPEAPHRIYPNPGLLSSRTIQKRTEAAVLLTSGKGQLRNPLHSLTRPTVLSDSFDFGGDALVLKKN
jgi:hypothetical protein